MLIAAITGNYGMGKSSVAGMFAKYGAVTLDSDQIVADLLAKKSVARNISDMLGKDVLNPDKSLNKGAVARRVFCNVAERKRLEAYLHPLVFREMKARIRKIKERTGLVLVEVPLLFEGGFQKHFDRTITVYTDQKTAITRLREKGISRKDALARLHIQMAIGKKQQLADYLVNNNGTKQQSLAQVRKIYKALIEDMAKVQCDPSGKV